MLENECCKTLLVFDRERAGPWTRRAALPKDVGQSEAPVRMPWPHPKSYSEALS